MQLAYLNENQVLIRHKIYRWIWRLVVDIKMGHGGCRRNFSRTVVCIKNIREFKWLSTVCLLC